MGAKTQLEECEAALLRHLFPSNWGGTPLKGSLASLVPIIKAFATSLAHRGRIKTQFLLQRPISLGGERKDSNGILIGRAS